MSIYDDKDDGVQSLGEQRRIFVSEYLSDLKSNLGRFGNFFSVLSFIYIIQTLLNFVFAFLIFASSEGSGSGIIGSIQLVSVAINFWLVVWVASICKEFVNLQVSKTENDAHFSRRTYEEGRNMTRKLLDKAREKVPDVIQTVSIYGTVISSPVSVNNSGVTTVRSNTRNENESLKEAIALLVAYCEVSHDNEAIRNAEIIKVEASKADKNNNLIMTCWTKIVSLIPTIADVTTIAEGVGHLIAK